MLSPRRPTDEPSALITDIRAQYADKVVLPA
jgi:hypothetical protein